MGRIIPCSRTTLPTAPPPPFPLLAAAIAASIAILFTLCISHHRKSTQSPSPTSPSSSPSSTANSIKNQTLTQVIKKPSSAPPPLPPPPTQSPTSSILSSPSRQQQRLSVSLSMRFSDGLSRVRTSLKEKRQSNGDCDEELVWKKRIILGEKCRVPSSDDEDEEMEVYDDNGNKLRNYHPKTLRSLQLSRTNSLACPERSPIGSLVGARRKEGERDLRLIDSDV